MGPGSGRGQMASNPSPPNHQSIAQARGKLITGILDPQEEVGGRTNALLSFETCSWHVLGFDLAMN